MIPDISESQYFDVISFCAAAGKLVFHGPREEILPFFETQGMKCPERKADSDFLQEVTSRKDQKVRLHVTPPPKLNPF